MKHSLTAVLAIVSAAGLAGVAQAQTTAQPAATPAPGAETTAPSTQSQSSTAPATPSAAQPTTATAAPKANMQQSSANDFWSRNISQDEVRQAQQQLAAQGLYRGPANGMVGSDMQRALTRFQQQNGLRQTATLDPDTMNRLMASNAPANPPGAGANTPPTGPAVGASTPPSGTTAPSGAGGNTTTAAPAAPNTQGQPATRY